MIVNCERFRKRRALKGFTFVLRLSRYENNSLRIVLAANPTENQPGNGRISLHKGSSISFPYYESFADILDEDEIDGSALAAAIRILFRSCGEESIHQDIMHEIYFFLLFEIGRRMVIESGQVSKSPLAKSYDHLPVAVTVVRIVDLFQRGIISPADVFRSRGMYNIFTGLPNERRIRICNLKFFTDRTRRAICCLSITQRSWKICLTLTCLLKIFN